MRFVIFGLAVSSSWGNGHAALWRGLISALLREGHRVTFYERDVPYYAEHRDLHNLPDGGELVFYRDWDEVRPNAARAFAQSDVGIVTSYCPDAIAATELVVDNPDRTSCFYDLDTPVTLRRLEAGENVEYLGPEGLARFDLVLSYTGGVAIDELKRRLGTQRVEPLYGWVDPTFYSPAPPRREYDAALSYLGTYAADRQDALAELFVRPARRRPHERFVIGGAQYPQDFPWTENIFFVRHLPPPEHAAFYASTQLTLNVTRGAMARMGWCPSGRLFEAAACAAPILTDWWEGLDAFFEPGEEIIVARTASDTLAALDMPAGDLTRIARRARARVLDQHTAAHRARQLVSAIERASVGAET